MQKYTVVLMRPEGGEQKLEERLYVAIGVKAADCYEAEKLGKREVWKADKRIARQEGVDFGWAPKDYIMLCIFLGVQDPKWFGFAPGFNAP